MQVRFPDQHRAGRAQPARDLRIRIGDPIIEHGARRRCPHARGVDVVLQRDRYAVQRPTETPAPLLGVESSSLCEGLLAQHGDETVQFGVVDVDAGQTSFGKLGRGYGASAHLSRGFSQGQCGQVSRHLRLRNKCSDDGSRESSSRDVDHGSPEFPKS